MKQVATFTQQPVDIYFENFNGADTNKVWMRKNIEEIEVENTTIDDEGKEVVTKITQYQADEVYFETSHTLDEIKADFDGFWEYGESWTPDGSGEDKGVMSNSELTDAVTTIQDAQVDIYDVIASLYETSL